MKTNSYLHVEEFSRECITKFLHSKRVACSVYSESLKFYGKELYQRSILQRQALADVYKIDVPEDFAKFTGKHLHASSLELYCKRDPGADVFLRIL